MKNIYITTFQDADNYGAMLQCFALYNVLMGKYGNVKVIRYNNSEVASQYKIIRSPEKNLIKTLYHLLIDLINYDDARKRKLNFNKFREAISFTTKINKIDELSLERRDILITGSDQVWNPKITKGLDDVYFLKCKKGNKKIAYAASCGDVSVLSGLENEFKKNILPFSAISVREKSLSDFINKKIGVKSVVVLDPTFLLSSREWKNYIGDNRIIGEKYIFVYSVGNANSLFYEVVDRVAKRTGLKVVFFDKKSVSKRRKKYSIRWYQAGPSEFLNLLYHSDLVITTSFHGFALSSILNKKMLIVLSTYPDRITTLADTFGLSGRIVKNVDEVPKLLRGSIDWDLVNKKLNRARTDSMEWLVDAIEGDGARK